MIELQGNKKYVFLCPGQPNSVVLWNHQTSDQEHTLELKLQHAWPPKSQKLKC